MRFFKDRCFKSIFNQLLRSVFSLSFFELKLRDKLAQNGRRWKLNEKTDRYNWLKIDLKQRSLKNLHLSNVKVSSNQILEAYKNDTVNSI